MRSSFGFDFPIAVDERFFPSIAKVGARMAQLFSNTYVGTLDDAGANIEWSHEDVPDLVGRNGHNFSDGIGTVSLDAFEELCRHLGVDVPAFASGCVSALPLSLVP